MTRYSIKNDRDSHTCMTPDPAGDWVSYDEASRDKARMDWLEKEVEHLPAHRGAPDATKAGVLINGGHFTAREAIDLCIGGDAKPIF